MAVIPFKVMVYDRDLRPLYSLPLDTPPDRPGVESIKVAPSLEGIGTASIQLPLDHPRARDLHEHGRRIRIWDQFGGHLLSGPITDVSGQRGESTRGTSTVTFSAQDDKRLLWRTLGWVAPSKPIDQQQSDNSDAQYKLGPSPAESVVKQLFYDNVTARLGIPVQTVGSQGRGQAIRIGIRNRPLADVLYPAVTQAGVGIEIRQEDTTGPTSQRVVLDCFTFTTHPQILDDTSPQIADWSYSVTGPEAMWGVAGGQGQGNARVFKQAVSQSEINGWGRLYGGEFFDDQRQESNPTSVQAALDAELLDKSAKARLEIKLQGTGQWAYGRAWRVGDFITTRLVPGAGVLTTQITSADLSWSPGEGYSATSTVGSTGKTTQAQVLKALAQQVSDLRAGW